MQSEPAKPITKLAEADGGAARPRPNRLGVAAKWLSTGAWGGGALIILLVPGTGSYWLFGVTAGLAIAGVTTGAVALSYARRDNLDSKTAYDAIFLIVVPMVLIVLYTLVFVLERAFR